MASHITPALRWRIDLAPPGRRLMIEFEGPLGGVIVRTVFEERDAVLFMMDFIDVLKVIQDLSAPTQSESERLGQLMELGIVLPGREAQHGV